MHILGAKQFNKYINDGKASLYRVKARLLNPHSRPQNKIGSLLNSRLVSAFTLQNISCAGSAANLASTSCRLAAKRAPSPERAVLSSIAWLLLGRGVDAAKRHDRDGA